MMASVAIISAAVTDHMPATAPRLVLPHKGSARKGASQVGNSQSERMRLQPIITPIGRKAMPSEGRSSVGAPLSISAGSKVEAVVVCSRIRALSTGATGDRLGS